ncbi:hypothetical protein [Paenibacillus sp. FSL R7-0128]|uniref:hypothetical protein n=1 Tax=Paenibacillus sp. FSL R7-0128 TaxID=2954529 RepID=UPI0030F710D4
MQRKINTESSHKSTPANRNIDRQYNGSNEEYEDAADYITMPDVLKGRVIA